MKNLLLITIMVATVFGCKSTPKEEKTEVKSEIMGAKRCLATASGTTALLTALHALGIDAEYNIDPF
jgi:dTDP-4-amino-4,6-dideoxygalactose transaminase